MDNRLKHRFYSDALNEIYDVVSINFMKKYIRIKVNGTLITKMFHQGKLMQCTGLSTARSYRGNKPEDLLVFEGDIIKQDKEGCVEGAINVVYWDVEGCWCVSIRSLEEPDIIHEDLPLSEIIEHGYICGNIYDNPELLTNPNPD